MTGSQSCWKLKRCSREAVQFVESPSFVYWEERYLFVFISNCTQHTAPPSHSTSHLKCSPGSFCTQYPLIDEVGFGYAKYESPCKKSKEEGRKRNKNEKGRGLDNSPARTCVFVITNNQRRCICLPAEYAEGEKGRDSFFQCFLVLLPIVSQFIAMQVIASRYNNGCLNV